MKKEEVVGADEDVHNDLENDLDSLTRTILRSCKRRWWGTACLDYLSKKVAETNLLRKTGWVQLAKRNQRGSVKKVSTGTDCDGLAWVRGYRYFGWKQLAIRTGDMVCQPQHGYSIKQAPSEFFNCTDDVISLAIHPQGSDLQPAKSMTKAICWTAVARGCNSVKVHKGSTARISGARAVNLCLLDWIMILTLPYMHGKSMVVLNHEDKS